LKPITFRHLLLIAGLIPGVSQAQDWWFEIELLMFSRLDSKPAAQGTEAFEQEYINFADKQHRDLLGPYLQPELSNLRDALPGCEAQLPEQVIGQTREFVLATELPELPWEQAQLQLGQLLKSQAQQQAERFLQQSQDWPQIMPAINTNACHFSFEQAMLDDMLLPYPQTDNWLAHTPVVIDGVENESLQQAYLLPKTKLQFKTLYRDIQRSKDKRPMLHLAWRQPVKFGRNKAHNYRLYAGENFARQFSANGELLVENDQMETQEPEVNLKPELDIFQQLELALQQPVPEASRLFPSEQQHEMQQQLTDLWQLDGLFKVYLKNIGRTPYLHIDSQFQYQTPVMQQQQLTLVRAEFKQLRRVISRQVHYFDHPQFGMVVQIRRYKRPTPEVEEQEQ